MSDVGAVHLIGSRCELTFRDEPERRLGGKEGGDDSMVFVGFEAARAVNEGAARAETRGCLFEEAQLGGGEAIYFSQLQTPAQIDAATENAGIGTGSVNQNAVEGRGRRYVGGKRGPDAGDAEAAAVLIDEREAVRMGVGG